MRSFKLFSKSRNIMPKNPEKLSREDTKRITENVENRLGLSDARPRLGGGPVMAALTAMAMIAVMVAGGIYIAGKDVMVVDPATNSYNTTVINGNVEFASDYIYCNMYLGSDMTSIEIELPYIYTERLPYMTVTGFFGSNTDGVTINTVDNSSMGSESGDEYDMGVLRFQLYIPWSAGKEVRIDSLTVDIDGVGENIAVKFGEPLRFHCVDAQTDEYMRIGIESDISNYNTIQNTVNITSSELRELNSIRMLTGDPLECYQPGSTKSKLGDYNISLGKPLIFYNYITIDDYFSSQKPAQICYIYANALLQVTDNGGKTYNVIASREDSMFALINTPQTNMLKDALLDRYAAYDTSTKLEMDDLSGNVYSQKVIDAMESELSEAVAGRGMAGDDNIKVTVDSVICDDITANIFLILEPGDNYTEHLDEFIDAVPDIEFLSGGDDHNTLDINIRKKVYNRDRGGAPIKCISISLNMSELGRERSPIMKISMPTSLQAFSVELDRNINMNEYCCDDGTSVYLSECAFYSSYETPTSAAEGDESFTLIDNSGNAKTYKAQSFGLEYYETYNTVSIEYNGKMYTKKGA